MKTQLINSTLKSLLFISILFSFSSFAERLVYMKVVGSQQGNIEGDSTDAVHTNQFKISEMHHLIKKPGKLSKTEHQPFIVTTTMAKGSTELMSAFDNGEQLTVTITFTLTSGSRPEHYRFVLNDATIIAAEPIMYDNTIAENLDKRLQIRYRFDYTSIEHIQNTIDSQGNQGSDNSVTLTKTP